MYRLFASVLSVVALCGFSPVRPADEGPVLLSVIDRDDGQELDLHPHRGQQWVAGSPGHRYSVRMQNRSGERVLVVLSVDGVNAITGQTASPSQSGYVLEPWQSSEITGWRKSNAEVAQFVFTASSDSYATRTGRPANVGVIGIAVFNEARRPVYDVRPLPMPRPAPRPMPQYEDRAEASASANARAAEAPAAPSAMAKSESRQRLGTGHGEREWSSSSLTSGWWRWASCRAAIAAWTTHRRRSRAASCRIRRHVGAEFGDCIGDARRAAFSGPSSLSPSPLPQREKGSKADCWYRYERCPVPRGPGKRSAPGKLDLAGRSILLPTAPGALRLPGLHGGGVSVASNLLPQSPRINHPASTVVGVLIVQGLLEIAHLGFSAILGPAITFLQPPGQILGVAFGHLHVVIGDVAPLGLHLALELGPLAGNDVFVHYASPWWDTRLVRVGSSWPWQCWQRVHGSLGGADLDEHSFRLAQRA